MNQQLSSFAARLRELISNRTSAIGNRQFSELALELFTFQFQHNSDYRKICEARQLTPQAVEHWAHIPSVPTAAFKELELTSIEPAARTTVFHSSGTTEQKPSRHFHCAESLSVYEASLWNGFMANVLQAGRWPLAANRLVCLTPPPELMPHSSLVHMFQTVQAKIDRAGVPVNRTRFFGRLADDGSWTLDFNEVVEALSADGSVASPLPLLMLGTAFSFVHLLDHLEENNLRLQLPPGSRVMETGGYKNRSRTLPKPELHALITERLAILPENILCEYGMSELSSQAYDSESHSRIFRFPSWVRVQIISPETGREVAEGEAGIIRIFDLANVFSVAAIQTEDLGVGRGDGFELVGRAQLAETRGCSLMSA